MLLTNKDILLKIEKLQKEVLNQDEHSKNKGRKFS
jgi:hypothetical protein